MRNRKTTAYFSEDTPTVTIEGITVSTKRELLVSSTTIMINIQRKEAAAEKSARARIQKLLDKRDSNQLELF